VNVQVTKELLLDYKQSRLCTCTNQTIASCSHSNKEIGVSHKVAIRTWKDVLLRKWHVPASFHFECECRSCNAKRENQYGMLNILRIRCTPGVTARCMKQNCVSRPTIQRSIVQVKSVVLPSTTIQ